MEINRQTTIAFTGHRTDKITYSQNLDHLLDFIFTELYFRIKSLHQQGYITFMSCACDGFDMIASEVIILSKLEFPDIQLILVVPFKGHDNGFNTEEKVRYTEICKQVEEIIYTSDGECADAYAKRNDFLMANCSHLVCYYDGQKGETRDIVNLALKLKIPITNIYENVIDTTTVSNTPIY